MPSWWRQEVFEKMMARKIFIFFLLISLSSAATLCATEEYAETTGRDCGVCHFDPAGGGELTATGTGYAMSLSSGVTETPDAVKISAASRLFRLLTGYLHILFGFFWFGTILYVHLILKPAYASRGLPRGEVKLGLVSMVVMGVTGAILFVYRVPDPAMLINSRFGLLLLLKIVLYLAMVGTAIFAVFFLGPRMRRRQATVTSTSGDMSLEELTQFDGKEGRPAHFAYRGDIYDATESPLWKNGTHMGRHQAGCDLTDVLSHAPHGENNVLAMPKVGRLLLAETGGPSPVQKLFYTLAYMNLGFVLLIILVLACWKWW